MKEVVVKTFDGLEVPRSKTRLISGEYYIPGRSCFFIDGKWYRITSPAIILDEFSGEYILKVEACSGVIGIEKDKIKIGTFKSPKENSGSDRVYIRSEGKTNVIHPSVNLNYDELIRDFTSVDSRVYILKAEASKELAQSNVPKNYRRYLSSYSICGGRPNWYLWDTSPITDQVKKEYANRSKKLRPEYDKLAKMLGKITFGVEFETCGGTLPVETLFNNGLIPVRDGSIGNNYEYTTIPLKGQKGLQTLEDSAVELEKFCSLDEHCSLHIHFGGVPNTKEYILSVFKAASLIQGEIFDLVPYYKRAQREVLGSEKDYCKPLPNIGFNKTVVDINKEFKNLYKFLSGGIDLQGELEKRRNGHPQGERKWERINRYYWINLIPIVFDVQETIEFRIHHMTFNPVRIINWLTFCALFLKFVEENQQQILDNKIAVTIDSVIDYAGKLGCPEYIAPLRNYFYHQREVFVNNQLNGNYLSKKECITEDFYEIPISQSVVPCYDSMKSAREFVEFYSTLKYNLSKGSGGALNSRRNASPGRVESCSTTFRVSSPDPYSKDIELGNSIGNPWIETTLDADNKILIPVARINVKSSYGLKETREVISWNRLVAELVGIKNNTHAVLNIVNLYKTISPEIKVDIALSRNFVSPVYPNENAGLYLEQVYNK